MSKSWQFSEKPHVLCISGAQYFMSRTHKVICNWPPTPSEHMMFHGPRFEFALNEYIFKEALIELCLILMCLCLNDQWINSTCKLSSFFKSPQSTWTVTFHGVTQRLQCHIYCSPGVKACVIWSSTRYQKLMYNGLAQTMNNIVHGSTLLYEFINVDYINNSAVNQIFKM